VMLNELDGALDNPEADAFSVKVPDPAWDSVVKTAFPDALVLTVVAPPRLEPGKSRKGPRGLPAPPEISEAVGWACSGTTSCLRG